MIAQFYEYAKNHWIVKFKWILFYINYISIKLSLKHHSHTTVHLESKDKDKNNQPPHNLKIFLGII